ncbi:MAG: hypothetical protein H6611_06685 [Ignavibacteriales bacterium]|nr:hypothetical protein [Ignavibacteriales bacterium]
MISKRKVIYFLVVVVVTLLIVNVLLGLKENNSVIENKDQITAAEIEKTFKNVLVEFGISDEWISQTKIKKALYDSIQTKYEIKIPSGVTIPVILKDVSAAFLDQPVTVLSEEKKIDGITELKIKSGNKIKLLSEFKYYPELTRNYSQIAFILNEFEEINDIEKSTLFNLAIPYGIVLPLENESQSIAETIKNNKREYFILIDDNSSDVDFELDNDLSLDEIAQHSKNIISSFNSPKYFFVNNSESGLNSSTRNYINEQFNKRGRELINVEEYLLLKGENDLDLISLFDFHLRNLNFGESRIFLISTADWLIIQDEVNKYLRQGNKVVYPTHIIK